MISWRFLWSWVGQATAVRPAETTVVVPLSRDPDLAESVKETPRSGEDTPAAFEDVKGYPALAVVTAAGANGFLVKAFSVGKVGASGRENEDASAINRTTGLIAVADGATEASYSRSWARLLVRGFCLWAADEDLRAVDWEAGMRALQERWHSRVPWDRLRARAPIFIEKARRGAFAAFLGVRLRRGSWDAIGIGDCNLFVVDRARSIRVAVPRQEFEQFNSTPHLLPSLASASLPAALQNVWHENGELSEGEMILTCTDAVAAFLLRRDVPQDALKQLLTVETEADFASWVANARSAGLRNDDSTVIIATMACTSVEES